MEVHEFHTYRFVLTNDDSQLVILDGRNAGAGLASLTYNPKMPTADLLKTLKAFQNVLAAAIGDLEGEVG